MYCRFLIECRLTHRPDDVGCTQLWNVGRHSTKKTAVHPRRFWASYSPPWELEISRLRMCLNVIVPFMPMWPGLMSVFPSHSELRLRCDRNRFLAKLSGDEDVSWQNPEGRQCEILILGASSIYVIISFLRVGSLFFRHHWSVRCAIDVNRTLDPRG
jgi:hypothetical protein